MNDSPTVEVRMFKTTQGDISLRYVYYTALDDPNKISGFSEPISLGFMGDEDESDKEFWEEVLSEIQEALNKPVLHLTETLEEMTEGSSGD